MERKAHERKEHLYRTNKIVARGAKLADLRQMRYAATFKKLTRACSKVIAVAHIVHGDSK